MYSNRMGSERAPGRNTDKPRGYKRHGTPDTGSNGRQLSPSNRSISSYPPKESFLSSLSRGILDSPESHPQLPLESYSPSSPSDSQHAFTMGTPLNDSYVVDNDYMGVSDWKSLLCPLSLNEDRLSSFSFYDDPYADSTLSPLHGLKGHPIAAPLSGCDSLWGSTWSTSPDSVDSDLDSESVLSSSTSHLSPESSESDLCDPSIESEDEFEDDDNFDCPYPTSMSNHLYPLDEPIYPSHSDHDALLPSSPPLPSQIASSSRLLSPSSPRERVSPLPLINDYAFQLHDAPTIIPSSPSRRTSRELPEDEDDSFGSELLGTALPSSSHTAPSDSRQQFVRLRSFPGAETDDDLIPSELASKNYIPDAAPITSHSLLLDMDDLPPARCPSPEDFTLDPSAFAGLEGLDVYKEMQEINRLREKTGKTQSWERERFRELSALLRLKTEMLGNATDNESASRAGIAQEDGGKLEDEPAVAPEHEQELTSAEESPCGDPSHLPNAPKFSMTSKDSNDVASPPPLKSSPKPKITNMAQLVATMVFHRQQDAIRRPPARPRTWAGPSYGNTMQTTSKTHPTPRSPLRQVSLPSDLEGLDREAEDDGDAENLELSELFDSPLPLSPLMLASPPNGWLEMSQ